MSIPVLSLVVPCYNEEKTLAACIERVLAIKDDSFDLEIIIVDDCSKDNSRQVAEQIVQRYSNIKLVCHNVNRGKGAALRTGFIHASGDYVGIQDADMEYEPQQYKILLEPLKAGTADVVYGSRYLRPDTRRILYFWHTWMNKTLTFASNMFTNLDITDMETCYKLFRREVIQHIAPQLKEDRFGFEPEVTALVANTVFNGEKLRVWECAITYNPRSYEEGKKIGWKDGVRALYCILHYSAHTAAMPMQILLYFIIGASCAIANIILFNIFYSFSAGLFGASSMAFILAAALNYWLCITILFRHKARFSAKGELMAYLACVGLMWLVDYLCTAGLVSLSLSPSWSKAWASVVGFAGNFLLRKYVVFGKK